MVQMRQARLGVLRLPELPGHQMALRGREVPAARLGYLAPVLRRVLLRPEGEHVHDRGQTAPWDQVPARLLLVELPSFFTRLGTRHLGVPPGVRTSRCRT